MSSNTVQVLTGKQTSTTFKYGGQITLIGTGISSAAGAFLGNDAVYNISKGDVASPSPERAWDHSSRVRRARHQGSGSGRRRRPEPKHGQDGQSQGGGKNQNSAAGHHCGPAAAPAAGRNALIQGVIDEF